MESAPKIKMSRVTSFDGWVLRADIGELDKDGRKIRLQQRPLLVLEELLAHPGELVTREQLIARLWPKGVVDFDTGLNTAVRKLRVALDDVGEVPRYIETIPRKGYRFIGMPDSPANAVPQSEPRAPSVLTPSAPQTPADTEDRPSLGVERRTTERRAADAAPVQGPAAPRPWLPYIIAAVCVLALGGLLLYLQRDTASSTAATSVRANATPLPDKPAIAVLPLKAATSAAADVLLGRIVSDTLKNRIGKFADAVVIDATSMPQSAMSPPEINRFTESVRARYLLAGTVARQQDNLRIELELVDARSGARLWSIDEQCPVGELGELIEKAVLSAANHLRLPANSTSDARTPAPIDLEAYDIYLQAEELMRTQRIVDSQTAVELYRRATVLEPGFARAYLGLAQALALSTTLGASTVAEQEEAGREASAALDRALALDPGLGEVFIERARFVAASPAEAESFYREGLRLAPNYGRGYQRYAEFLYDEYRRGEALEAIERAHAIDPLDPRLMVRLAMYRYFVDSDGDAHDRLVRKAVAINPKLVLGLMQLSMSAWFNRGDFAEAIHLAEQAIQIDPSSDWMKIHVATIYLDVDDPEAALAVLKLCAGEPNALVDVALYQRDGRRAAQLARKVIDDDWRTKWGAPEAWALRDEAIGTGDFKFALKRLEERFALAVPWGQARTAGPRAWNRSLGVVYAHALVLAGETQRGRKLAQLILVQLDGESIGRTPFYMSRDRAAVFAILGDKERALEELKNSLATHHWSYWWYYGELDPLFDGLRSDPRFQVLVTRAKEHRVRQRALLEEMRRNGLVPRRQ
jgi:DNA-binding winged helix-turn-helix (wHTH) protein/TolB-like protein/Tfp pilus assembly protein PilF